MEYISGIVFMICVTTIVIFTAGSPDLLDSCMKYTDAKTQQVKAETELIKLNINH